MKLETYKLGDVSIIVNGATPSTSDASNYDGSVVWITPKDLSAQKTKFVNKGARNISKKGYDSCSTQIIPANNILMSSRAPIGLLAINGVDCCTNQGFKNIVIDKCKCDVDYLYYYLKNHIREIEALGSGTTFKEISRASLQNYTIRIPSLTEQKKIGSILSLLDSKIELNRRINDNLEAMAKQLYDYWFVQFDFPNEEGRPYKSSGGEMVWNEKLKREIPKGWKVMPLNNWLDIKSGYAFKSETYQQGGTYKIITIKNVQDHHLETSGCDCINIIPNEIKEWCKLTINDRLISLTGNCGRLCIVTENNLLLNQRVGLIDCEKYLLNYAYAMLSSKEFQTLCSNLAKGAAQANLSPIELCKSLAQFPPKMIIENFEKAISSLIKKYIQCEIENKNLQKQRDELLPLLTNGQLTIK